MSTEKFRVISDLKACVDRLLISAADGDNSDLYHECCGRVWAYANLGYLSNEAAFAWIDAFAAAAEGKTTGDV